MPEDTYEVRRMFEGMAAIAHAGQKLHNRSAAAARRERNGRWHMKTPLGRPFAVDVPSELTRRAHASGTRADG
jgi:hypothetical protein